MGIDLDRWKGKIIAQDRGVVRLLPVAERAEILFGADGATIATNRILSDAKDNRQISLAFSEQDTPRDSPTAAPRGAGRFGADAVMDSPAATALDRVHAAMLLQASGHATYLRTLIVAEQERGPDFLRLANALSALYPRGSAEKRVLDAMLLAVPR